MRKYLIEKNRTLTLGVAVEDYWRWQILTLSNLAIAPILAITGIGCAYKRERTSPDDQS